MKPRITSTLAALAVVAGSAWAGTAAATPSATGCVNLKASPAMKAQLLKVHDRPRDGKIRPGSVYYGRCGSTEYAIASFSKVEDGPEKFRKLKGRGWRDFGDTFEDGCSIGARYPIPYEMVHVWGFCPHS